MVLLDRQEQDRERLSVLERVATSDKNDRDARDAVLNLLFRQAEERNTLQQAHHDVENNEASLLEDETATTERSARQKTEREILEGRHKEAQNALIQFFIGVGEILGPLVIPISKTFNAS